MISGTTMTTATPTARRTLSPSGLSLNTSASWLIAVLRSSSARSAEALLSAGEGGELLSLPVDQDLLGDCWQCIFVRSSGEDAVGDDRPARTRTTMRCLDRSSTGTRARPSLNRSPHGTAAHAAWRLAGL